MRSLQSTVGTLPGYLIYFGALLLVGGLLAVLLRLIRERQGKVRIMLVALHFLSAFFLFAVLVDYSYNALLEARPQVLHPFEFRLLALPWLLFAALELASAAVLLLHMRYLRTYRRTHLTKDAIRQTVDGLPTGLMFSEPDGTVQLANLKMAKLCRKLTGELLSDAGRFWKHIEDSSEDLLIHTADGQTWQFAKSRITLHGDEYDQVMAVDLTEQYRVTEQLSQTNRHLKQVQDRMKAVAAQERSLTAEREIMNARMTVHNRMGAVLLSGKYYLDHPENVKEGELLHLLEFNNHFLLGEVEQPEVEADPLQEAIRTAGRIGVGVELRGPLPEDGTARRILAQAIDQCAANTARHAGGDRLTVAIEERPGTVAAVFSNNGSVPSGPITETGGLAVLRRAVEAAGGSMRVQSEPAFALTFSIPQNT